MTKINLSVGLLILTGLTIGIISILPTQICLFGSCANFLPLITIKNLINYFFKLGVLLGSMGIIGIAIYKPIKFIFENDFVKSLLSFLISFDDESYEHLKKVLTKKRNKKSTVVS